MHLKIFSLLFILAQPVLFFSPEFKLFSCVFVSLTNRAYS